jgi:regulator of protease activity HflC (stomatin/prohibitin superfamily)
MRPPPQKGGRYGRGGTVQEQPEPAVWVLLGVPFLGLLALALLRWVPADHVLVVTRRGLVTRVVPPGLAVRNPVSTSVLVPTSPDVALLGRGTTREGIHVRMVVETDAEVRPPAPRQPYVDALGAAVPVGEQVLADVVGTAGLEDLPAVVERAWDDLTDEVDRVTSPLGLHVRSMRLVELDAVLVPGADGPR